MRPDWDPPLYRRFEDERTRPARDLLAQVAASEVADVVDLGCGPGNSTEILAARFPRARVVGIDSSKAMIEAAQQRLPQCRFELGDARFWQPSTAPGLIFANAVLHWAPDHASLFPRLFAQLAPRGVLAVQMPDNLSEASHRLMQDVAAEGPWSAALAHASAARAEVLPPSGYYDLLAPGAAGVDVWRTVYHHPLPSAGAIVGWFKSTGLKPYLDPLPEPQRVEFLRAYEARIALAYPPQSDGTRLLAFPRLFVVARRGA